MFRMGPFYRVRMKMNRFEQYKLTITQKKCFKLEEETKIGGWNRGESLIEVPFYEDLIKDFMPVTVVNMVIDTGFRKQKGWVECEGYCDRTKMKLVRKHLILE